MRIRRVLWTTFALAALAFAQEKAPDAPKEIPKIIPVHYVDVRRLQNLVNIPGVNVKADDTMRVLVVTGSPDAVATIEELVKKLDVPPTSEITGPNFELTGYLVSGGAQSRSDELPADLAGVAKQLHSLFPYKSYRLMDTLVMRGTPPRPGSRSDSSTSGMLPGTNSLYNFGYAFASVSGGSPQSVRFGDMHLNITTPTSERDKDGNFVHRTVGLRSDVDIPEGRKVVVGKSNFTGSDDALILVLSVKIVE